MDNMQPVNPSLDYDDSIDEGEIIQLVGLKLGEEEYAIDVLKIQEIIRPVEITAVPRTDSFVLGVMNLRGKVIPVIDLRVRFALDKMDFDKETRIIVVRFESENIGFVVDEVTEVIRINKSMVEPTPPLVGSIGQEYILGICKYEERLIILLDIDSVIADGKTVDSDLRRRFFSQPALEEKPKVNYEEVAKSVESEAPQEDEPKAIEEPEPEPSSEPEPDSGGADDGVGDDIDALIAQELAKREKETEEMLERKKDEPASHQAEGDADDEVNAVLEDALSQTIGNGDEANYVEQDDLDALIAKELEKREKETEEMLERKKAEKKNEELGEAEQEEPTEDESDLDDAVIQPDYCTVSGKEKQQKIEEEEARAEAEMAAQLEDDSDTSTFEEDTSDEEKTKQQLIDEEEARAEAEMAAQLEDEPDTSTFEEDTSDEEKTKQQLIDEEEARAEAEMAEEIGLDEGTDDSGGIDTDAVMDDDLGVLLDEIENGDSESEPESAEDIAEEEAAEAAFEDTPEEEKKDQNGFFVETDSIDDLRDLTQKIINGDAVDLGVDIKGELGELVRLIMDTKERVDEVDPTIMVSKESMPVVVESLEKVNETTEEATMNLMEAADKMSSFYAEFIGDVDDFEDLVYKKDITSVKKKLDYMESQIGLAEDLGFGILHSLEFQDITEQKLRKVINSVEDIGARIGAILGLIKAQSGNAELSDDTSQDDIDKLLMDFGLG
ncbi:chemotaxis protein CheW [Limisalsivibrio acetivorans]|uniref:chemotaxis protein CheW n=1 Tax=Limisalsivibrio acetivorans TaxID=1304888 RepID=UPI0003B53F45|nr:chemotaxis protein CheW [Limisalsivibrio acetivorans]